MFGVLGFREKGRGLAQGVGFRDIMDKACGLGILGFQGVGFWLSVGLLRFGHHTVETETYKALHSGTHSPAVS